MAKIILHLDMDAFFASVEQAVNPAYAGKPLIVGSRHRKYNTVVAACSYEAKACGIHSGMSTRAAFQLCPQALFVPADSAKYIYTSDEIAQLLRPYTDRGERASIDEFFLDAGTMSLPQAEAMARDIKSRIKSELHITGSIGIAPTRILAKMAAKRIKPDGLLVVEEGTVLDFLKNIPVEAVPGIGPSLKERLNLLSVFTCGQLHTLDLEFLAGRFGKIGAWLWGISRMKEGYEISNWESAELPPKSVGHSYTLERDIHRLDTLKIWIRLLSEMVAYRLRRDGLQAKVVHFYMSDREDFYSREKKFYSATSDPEEIYRRCLIILKTFGLKNICARALGVSVSCLLPAERNHLFEKDQKREQLLSAVDRINDRFGDWSIFPAVLKQK
jgi:DNA polymerase-4